MPSVKTHVNNLRINRFFFVFFFIPIIPPIWHINDYRLPWQVPLRYMAISDGDAARRRKKREYKKTPKQKEKVHGDGTLWLHSLLCSETRRHHTRRYTTSLHSVKVKASRDTGEILLSNRTRILQFLRTFDSRRLIRASPFSVRVAFSDQHSA